MVSLIRQRVDSRAPILSKWVENIAWWQHVIEDTATYLLPDLLSALSPEEVNLGDPEGTARGHSQAPPGAEG